MEEQVPLNGAQDLDALDEYLMSDLAPDDSMGLSDLDGFLTGIAVGPELILPSEWLPVIWGGGEPEFKTEAEMRTVLGAIMSRYNEIITCLDSEPENFDPIFMEGPEGEVIASDWAAGFLDAVALRTTAWDPLIAHDRAGIMMLPILLLNGDAELAHRTDGFGRFVCRSGRLRPQGQMVVLDPKAVTGTKPAILVEALRQAERCR